MQLQSYFNCRIINSNFLEVLYMKTVWKKKNLPKSDCQQPSDGSNPTGNLRLSQAGYKVDGKKIDQTKYFRNDVFGDCDWEKTKNGEKTSIKATIEINDIKEGDYCLKVTHEPHRESDQDNVTTILHWGDANKLITSNDLTGKDLTLKKGKDNSYKIIIK